MKTNNNGDELISIIIPVYNSEKTFEKCIASVLRQSYTNIEVLVVNDGSKGNISELIENYNDPRIKYLCHEKNRGLFRARLTGYESSSGEYICTLDSDDFISVDFIQVMLEEIVKNKADIVACNFVMDYSNGERKIDNIAQFTNQTIKGQKVMQTLLAQEGRNHYWHVVWNKIYHRSVWEKAYKYLGNITDHIIMGEDILYSSVFYFYCNKLVTTEYIGHFYFQHAEASTNLSGGVDKFKKSISDLEKVFSYVEKFYLNNALHPQLLEKFHNWKLLYSKFWTSNIDSAHMSFSDKNMLKNLLKEHFNLNELQSCTPRDSYFYSIKTMWDGRLEEIKESVVSEEISHISFDVFDTLLLRPFYDPSDMFYLLDDYFHKHFIEYPYVDFHFVRRSSEQHIRELLQVKFVQDVTLDEIYDRIYTEFQFPEHIVEEMKEYELALEYEFVHARKTVKRLYDLAVRKGKKVICISDMYLSGEIISKMLEKIGVYPDEIFVSSEIKLTKSHGDLYPYVINKLDTKSINIVHIGDNWRSDYVKAKEFGINAYYIPKTTEVIEDELGDIRGGGIIKNLKRDKGNLVNNDRIFDSFAIRSMYSVIANQLFDNPFCTFNMYSDYNASPYNIGYGALGMHMFSVVKMILDDSKDNKYKNMVFLARDGFLPKQVYDLIKDFYQGAAESKYLFASRKSLLPFLINDKYSFYNLPNWFNYKNYTISKFIELMSPILDDFNEEDRIYFLENGFSIDKKMRSTREFNRIIDIICERLLNIDKLKDYKDNMKIYFETYFENPSAIFDIGYSARAQIILNLFLNKKIDGYYIHSNSDNAYRYSSKVDFKFKDFYDYTPSITGTIREMLVSDLTGSCLSYETINGIVEPKIEAVNDDYIRDFAIETIQRGALDFINDYLQYFGKYLPSMNFRYQDASMTFENFLAYPKDMEKQIFKFIDFEDDIYLGENENIITAWDKALHYHRLGDYKNNSYNNFNVTNIRSRWKRVFFFIIFDHATLKTKVHASLQGKPLMLHWVMRIYHLFKKKS